MTKKIKTRYGFELELPSPAENKQINKGISEDPDTYIPSDEEFENARKNMPTQPQQNPNPMIRIRLDLDVVAGLRDSGAGWQDRVNTLLKKAIAEKQL